MDTNQFMSDPFTQSLLGLGGGLLSQSGWSRMPVSNGQALGQGLLGAQQGYTTAFQNKKLQQGLLDEQKKRQAEEEIKKLIGQSPQQIPMPEGQMGPPQTTPGSGILADPSLSNEQRGIYGLLANGQAPAAAVLADVYKAQHPANQGLVRAPSPYELSARANGQNTGHPLVDSMTPAQARKNLQEGSFSGFQQGIDENGMPVNVQVPSRGIPTGENGSRVSAIRRPYVEIPEGARKDISTASKDFMTFKNLNKDYKDGYGGYGLDTAGNLALAAGGRSQSIPGAAPQAAVNWWKNYRMMDLSVKHGLIGSAMTATELDQYEKATVSPGLSDATIKDNLKTRENILKQAAQRIGQSYSQDNFNPNVVKSLLGDAAPDILGTQKNKRNPILDKYGINH